jgi:hypothetical protein
MSTVGRPTSTIMFGMVFSTTWLEFKDMAKDPLVRQMPNMIVDVGLPTVDI